MKRIWTYIIAAALFILAIPAIALLPSGVTHDKPPEGRYYPVLDVESGKVMKLEPTEYIKGVVAAEMPIDYHIEALKAQAVAAHSYTLSQLAYSMDNPRPEQNGALLSTDSNEFQAYASLEKRKIMWGSSFEANEILLTTAVESVIDIVMTYNGAPISAAFCALSNGITEDAENVWGGKAEYLVSVLSEGDKLSPDYISQTEFSDGELATAIAAVYPEVRFSRDREKWFSELERSQSGNVLSLKAGTVKMSGSELRKALSLKSADFTISHNNNKFLFTTKGYGHGVGMSQYGADYMARQGADYREILSHYYTGISYEKIKAAV